jgi:sigma-B regulation protein RsbQ
LEPSSHGGVQILAHGSARSFRTQRTKQLLIRNDSAGNPGVASCWRQFSIGADALECAPGAEIAQDVGDGDCALLSGARKSLRSAGLSSDPLKRQGSRPRGNACADKSGHVLKEQSMDVQHRNNVQVGGKGKTTLVFAHGFGCDLNMWRFLAPAYADRYRTVLFDLVGSGNSDLAAYDSTKYGSLQGYADDLLQITEPHADGPIILISHSVSAMIGVLADLALPGRFTAHVMIGPSPCYINHDDYVGGFDREDIDSLLETLESNYLGWASTMAPAIMGAPGQPELAEELTNSFCRTDPEIAKEFARVTFLSDNRPDLAQLTTPTLILQCSDDLIAPRQVGEYMHRVLPASTLRLIENVGHCPHLSAPSACMDAIDEFLSGLRR